MRYRIAVEDIQPGQWVAWALDLPACYISAKTADEAVAGVPRGIVEYFSWIHRRDPLLPIPPETVHAEVVETFHSHPSTTDPKHIVNAFFEDDRRPLSYWDVAVVRRLLDWTRQDLLTVTASLDDPLQKKSVPADRRGMILEIIRHVASAENWYFRQMGLSLEPAALTNDPLNMIDLVRKNTNERLGSLLEDVRITQDRDELWSSRKVLRRTLWHERDHTQHIQQLLAGGRGGALF